MGRGAYPSAGDPASASGYYLGHLSVYAELGFEQVEESGGQWLDRRRLSLAQVPVPGSTAG